MFVLKIIKIRQFLLKLQLTSSWAIAERPHDACSTSNCLLSRLRSAAVLHVAVLSQLLAYKHCASKQQCEVYCVSGRLTARFKSQNCGKVVFSRISLLLVPEPNVSVLWITVCTILDNDGIPPSDNSDDLCWTSVTDVYFLAHVRSDDRQPSVIICWNSTSHESASMLSKNSLL